MFGERTTLSTGAAVVISAHRLLAMGLVPNTQKNGSHKKKRCLHAALLC